MQAEIEALLKAWSRSSNEEQRVINDVLHALHSNAKSRHELLDRLKMAVIQDLDPGYVPPTAERNPPRRHPEGYGAPMPHHDSTEEFARRFAAGSGGRTVSDAGAGNGRRQFDWGQEVQQ